MLCAGRFNPLTAKLFNLNFHPLENVSRWRDPQLQVRENYSDLTKWRSTLFKSYWLMSHFRFNMLKGGTQCANIKWIYSAPAVKGLRETSWTLLFRCCVLNMYYKQGRGAVVCHSLPITSQQFSWNLLNTRFQHISNFNVPDPLFSSTSNPPHV